MTSARKTAALAVLFALLPLQNARAVRNSLDNVSMSQVNNGQNVIIAIETDKTLVEASLLIDFAELGREFSFRWRSHCAPSSSAARSAEA